MWPTLRTYTGRNLRRIALPLGGIGTGTVSLGGRGNLRDWEIVNRPAKGFHPGTAFFALRTESPSGAVTARALEGPLDLSEYEGAHGSGAQNHGLPRFRDATFTTAYPFGRLELRDGDVPVEVDLEAFNPFVPTDVEASSWPVAVLRFAVTNRGPEPLTVSIAGALQNFIGRDGRTDVAAGNYNTLADPSGVLLRSRGVDPGAEQYGSIALAVLDGQDVTRRTGWADRTWGDSLLDFWDDFSADGRLDERVSESATPVASVADRRAVAAGATERFTFLLGWHFPNRRGWENPDFVGNHYTTLYADAWDALTRFAPRLDDLERRTVRFVDAFVSSDLPDAVKEAALFNLSTLRTQTVFRTPDGRFFGWEGCSDHEGSCMGTCTHVWNYEQATPYLFGEIARSMREIEFAHATGPDGLMSFRVGLPLDTKARNWTVAAADGQLGCLVKLYREWRLSGDDELLRSLWPAARRALEFCWIPGGWDADRDGVMEGCQHNTMDVEYYGPNPQMQSWYLAALRACEEMATYLGDDLAGECRKLFASGSAWMDEHLFNGEYYRHEIRPPASADDIAPGLREQAGAPDPTHPVLQLGDGCLVDQLVGQHLARLTQLGSLLNEEHVATTLRSIVRYNRLSGFTGHFNHMRSYVLGADESAVLMCSYPRGNRPERPFPYFTEVMTGFEHILAVGLMSEGMIDEGIHLVTDIRHRYDGERRNPYDEAECGHHYARAMASWGAVIQLTGFGYDAHTGVMRFTPHHPDVRRVFWSTGDAYGTFDTGTHTLQVHEGDPHVTSIYLNNLPIQLD
ncbi:GH116 family glycosyl-hydrolase [Kribbella solani]|uniref:GH116 family glycosyl-hydrolase n=1 Tax=Kribbella solani TaxID=236067 RepID=UPI0029A7AF16|nr:GH116 family glycosyl-hydrolase [Kribbella solani]MDX2967702.1 GH116 family glycosyl-hydrolase [Kribbella solani]